MGLLALLGVSILAMQKSQDERVSRVHIGDAVVEVEIADSPEEREVGLSNRDSLAQGSGMLFIFPEEGEWSFWMKDTHIALDIIWANAEGRVVSVAKNVLPDDTSRTYKPTAPALYVLEVAAGFAEARNIAEGSHFVVE